jgi:hypothetical protein
VRRLSSRFESKKEPGSGTYPNRVDRIFFGGLGRLSWRLDRRLGGRLSLSLRRLRLLLGRLKWLRILRRSLEVLTGLVKFFIELFPRFSKLIHTLPQTTRQLGEFFRSEQN